MFFVNVFFNLTIIFISFSTIFSINIFDDSSFIENFISINILSSSIFKHTLITTKNINKKNMIENNNNNNNYQNFDFIRQQWKFLQIFVRSTINNDNDDNSSHFIANVNAFNDNDNLKSNNVFNVIVINIERHVFYIGVYMFIDKLKKLIVRKNNERV